MKTNLANILAGWLREHKHLKKFYKVYRLENWPSDDEWPDILALDGVEAFIGMSCDGVGVALAIMNDHVYYRNTSKGPKFRIMAGDPNFFKKVERDLRKFHRKIHKNDDCNADMV